MSDTDGGARGKARWAVLVALCSGQFIMVLGSTVMNVSIQRVIWTSTPRSRRCRSFLSMRARGLEPPRPKGHRLLSSIFAGVFRLPGEHLAGVAVGELLSVFPSVGHLGDTRGT
jgi:hypothetical protein